VEFFLYGERIQKCIKNTPCISPQLVEVYTLIAWFREDRHHIYIQAKKDPREEWVQKKYKITKEDIHLIMQDWDPYWKVPANGIEMEHPDNNADEQGNEKGNGYGNEQGKDTE
jgi:hypothetical protein